MSEKCSINLLKSICSDQKQILYIFDYDGTLVELVADPSKAILRPSQILLINQLSNSKDVKVIILSGRDLKTLKSLCSQYDTKLNTNIMLIGSHGAEFNQEVDSNPIAQKIQYFVDQLKQLNDFQLLDLEYKTLSLAVHYRRHPNPKQTVDKLHSIAQTILGIQIQEGYRVFEIVPLNVNKGIAIKTLHEQCPHDFLIYFGDDLTDNYAFIEINSLQGLSIQVARRFDSDAKYFVDSVTDVYKFIESMIH